jgi:hypothetical protein
MHCRVHLQGFVGIGGGIGQAGPKSARPGPAFLVVVHIVAARAYGVRECLQVSALTLHF